MSAHTQNRTKSSSHGRISAKFNVGVCSRVLEPSGLSGPGGPRGTSTDSCAPHYSHVTVPCQWICTSSPWSFNFRVPIILSHRLTCLGLGLGPFLTFAHKHRNHAQTLLLMQIQRLASLQRNLLLLNQISKWSYGRARSGVPGPG